MTILLLRVRVRELGSMGSTTVTKDAICVMMMLDLEHAQWIVRDAVHFGGLEVDSKGNYNFMCVSDCFPFAILTLYSRVHR